MFSLSIDKFRTAVYYCCLYLILLDVQCCTFVGSHYIIDIYICAYVTLWLYTWSIHVPVFCVLRSNWWPSRLFLFCISCNWLWKWDEIYRQDSRKRKKLIDRKGKINILIQLVTFVKRERDCTDDMMIISDVI